MGPMESYLASLPNTAAKANEALEAVAAGGVASIVDGLADAASGARSLADVFRQMSRQIIADLLRIQIQKAVVGALGGATGGAGLLARIGGVIAGARPAGGRALGGPVLAGRTYRVGERGPELITMGAKGHVIPNNENPRGIAEVVPSPYFDVVVDGRSARVAAPLAVQAASVGSTGAQTAMMRRQARRIP